MFEQNFFFNLTYLSKLLKNEIGKYKKAIF